MRGAGVFAKRLPSWMIVTIKTLAAPVAHVYPAIKGFFRLSLRG